ncbi:MAG: RNA polymerase sigma factor [Firmicutes bacterium]|nr:RNA polymerase sigma factor [Bacillota bacterium]
MDKVQLEIFMRQLHSGNINALDNIYTLTSKSIYMLSCAILKNTEKAKDIMQETFIRVVANIDKYKSDNALAWILTIARNLSYREYANSGRSISLDIFKESVSDGKSTEELWTGEIDLNKAMAQLSVEEREVVTLFSIKGYKHREIAQIIGKPLGTVLWMYNKTIKKLKKMLEYNNKTH